MGLQGYADQPCPQWDTKPPPQHMSWPSITPDSRRLKPLSHHDQLFVICCLNVDSKGNIIVYYIMSTLMCLN